MQCITYLTIKIQC